jgi:hypothetical protein
VSRHRGSTTAVYAAIAFTLLFAVPSAGQSWLAADWTHRLPLVASADRISGDEAFEDFPLLIALEGPAHSEVFVHANADGSDLVVTGADGVTVFEREIVTFDAFSQRAEIWVRVPSFSKTESLFFVYFGNPGATLPAATPASWSADYRAVYHFAEDPAGQLLRDSSPAGANVQLVASRNWTSADVVEGPLHQAWNFNGTTHHLSSNQISCSDSSFVVSAWISHAGPGIDLVMQTNPGFWEITSQINSDQPNPGMDLESASVRWRPDALPYGSFHHFAWVFDGIADTVIFYYDGVPQTVKGIFPASASPFYRAQTINPNGSEPVGILGPMFFNGFDLHHGAADEFRLRAGVISENWVRTEFANQSDPMEFFEIGAVQNNQVTAVDPLSGTRLSVIGPNPFHRSTAVRLSLTRPDYVRLTVYDAAGRSVRLLTQRSLDAGAHDFRWDGRAEGGRRAAAGVYFLQLVTSDSQTTTKVSFLR